MLKGLFINLHCVYRHTCPNGKVYIGITNCKPEVRWQSGYGYKNNGRFFKDILHYGWSNIKHEILADNLTKEEAIEMESAQITIHNSLLPQYGYNQTSTDVYAQNKAVNQYSTEGKLLCTYHSIKSAAQSVGVHGTSIRAACLHNGVSRGYLWKYAADSSPLVIPQDIARRTHKQYNGTHHIPLILSSFAANSSTTSISGPS